jgi:hypothetical protein
MRRTHLPFRLVRCKSLSVCLALVLTSLAMLPVRLVSGRDGTASQGQGNQESNDKARKVKAEEPQPGSRDGKKVGDPGTLFESAEYAARNRSNHDYVYDLYKTYLMRDPDQGGWDLIDSEFGRFISACSTICQLMPPAVRFIECAR